jgi:hypothetical protein
MAAATVVSSKISPQAAMPLWVVRLIGPVLVVVELAPPRAWRLRGSTKCAWGGQSLVDDWEVACFPAQGD